MKENGKPRKRRLARRILLLLILALVVAGAGWYAYSALKMEYTVTYDSYSATTGSISNSLSFSGNLSLVDSQTYTAASSSTVKKLYATAGDAVKADDRLARLSNGETVTADFDGRVNTVSVAEGDAVSQGDSLIQVADFAHMKVSFRVDEYDIGDIRVGMACTVTVTALEKQFASTVAAINYISSSTGNVAYYTATAYVDVDEGVLPGMQVTVTIPQEEAKDVVILKVDALSFDNTNQAYVWMKDDAGELEQVFVDTGVSNGNYIEITDGLSDGDEVYVEAEVEQASTNLLAGLFGARQFNQPTGGGNNRGGNMSGAGGERGNWSGTGGSGGNRPGGDGGSR